MFLSEISPTHLRGAVGTLNQFGIVVGMLVANVLGLHQVYYKNDIFLMKKRSQLG